VCPLAGRKEENRVACPHKEKAYQEKKPAHLVRGKVQEYGEKEVRRVEEEKAARPKRGEAQQEWKRSSTEELRKRAEEHCGKGIPREVQLLELGWIMEEVVVSYLTCKCGEKGSHIEDNRGQGVIPFWKWKELSWCGCTGKKEKGGAPTERKSAARVEKAAL